MQSTIKGLGTGLSAVLTVLARLPSQHADRVALARQCGSAIFTGGGVALPDGSSVRITEFDIARLGDIPSSSRPSEMKAVFDNLSDSAKRQLSGIRGGRFLVGFHGIDGGQLLSVAGQDQDAAQSPTALRLAVSRFLASSGRDLVFGVGFLSESALNPVQNGLVESGGTAYYFPKRESPLWSEDFGGLLPLTKCRRAR